jgi:pimeloyl-ACP methyl ester carboxylesterase
VLELIDRGSCSDAHPTPLLFVHGATLAAWCWDEHFLDFFGDNGYRVIALNLRGHGDSPVSKPLNKCTIADYVDDVRSVTATLPVTPVLIGHSMGGFIVQKYLESGKAPAAVLMSSAPPRTWFRRTLHLIPRHPWLSLKVIVTRNPLAAYPSASLVRENYFCKHTPQDVVNDCFSRLADESYQALFVDMAIKHVRPERMTTPLLALEAEEVVWGHKLALDIGRSYHTEVEFFPNMGHNMMLEPGWQAVAERIDSWLGAQGL